MASTGTAADGELREDEESSRMSRERVVPESGVPEAEEGARREVRESGFAPMRARRTSDAPSLDAGNDHLELALAESTRTEANLNSLLRGLHHLTAGTRAARDANAALSRELETVRDLLDRSRADESVLRQRIRFLEQALVRQERDSERAHAAFVAQEDAFLAELLADHQRALEEVEQRLSRPADRVTPLHPPPPDTLTPAMLGAVKLRTLKIPMPTPRDGEEGEERGEQKLLPPRPASRPMPKQTPEPPLRPSGGYRLAGSDVAEERLEGAHLARPPSRPPE